MWLLPVDKEFLPNQSNRSEECTAIHQKQLYFQQNEPKINEEQYVACLLRCMDEMIYASH